MAGDQRYVRYSSVGMAMAAISFASIFIRWSDAPAVIIAAYRMLFASFILLPFALLSGPRRELGSLRRDDLWRMGLIGIVLAIHFLTFIAALQMTTVTSATVLVTMHPIIVALLACALLRERISFGAIGIAMGLAGMVVISSGDLFRGRLEGDLLAVAGALAAAAYILGGRVVRQRIGIVAYALIVYASASAALFAIAMITGTPLAPPRVDDYVIFFALALVCTIFGHTVLNWSLRYLPAAFVSLSFLGEPVGASILALLILGEAPTMPEVMGGAMVLAGILFTARSDLSRGPPSDTTPGL